MATTAQFFNGDFAIAEAQECERMLLAKTGQRAIWCVVTRKGFWLPEYFFAGEENVLRTKFHCGHKILLAFAVSRRQALASCSNYEPVALSAADQLLRRFARYAMKHA